MLETLPSFRLILHWTTLPPIYFRQLWYVASSPPIYNKLVTDELETKHFKLLFGVRRSIRYHSRRQMFFDRFHKVTSGINIVFGSAALMTILAKSPSEITAAAALVVTLFSTVDLVVGS